MKNNGVAPHQAPLVSEQPPRFLCVAGFDTRLARDGIPDRQILREAVDEGRWLLTLDRNIMEHKLARGVAILMQQGTLDAHAEFLATRFELD